VTFRYPTDESKIFVKRVIGLPGDHIRLAGKQVIRNGRRLSEPYVQHNASRADAFRDNFPADPPTLIPARGLDMLAHHVSGGEVIVPAGSLFVLGDNRDDSADSRYWGFVPRENVVGRPLLVYLSYAGTRIRWNRTLHFLGSAPPTELQP
jgi:signal peptidase I